MPAPPPGNRGELALYAASKPNFQVVRTEAGSGSRAELSVYKRLPNDSNARWWSGVGWVSKSKAARWSPSWGITRFLTSVPKVASSVPKLCTGGPSAVRPFVRQERIVAHHQALIGIAGISHLGQVLSKRDNCTLPASTSCWIVGARNAVIQWAPTASRSFATCLSVRVNERMLTEISVPSKIGVDV